MMVLAVVLACGVPDFGATLAAVAEAFASKRTPVHTPMLELGGGPTLDGDGLRLALGYGWGEHEAGFLPGTTVSRVMIGAQLADRVRSLDATYGWYSNVFGTLALDLGVEAQLPDREATMSDKASVGPTARLTLGIGGVGVQLSGGIQLGGDEPRFAGAAQLVVEVMDLGGSL